MEGKQNMCAINVKEVEKVCLALKGSQHMCDVPRWWQLQQRKRTTSNRIIVFRRRVCSQPAELHHCISSRPALELPPCILFPNLLIILPAIILNFSTFLVLFSTNTFPSQCVVCRCHVVCTQGHQKYPSGATLGRRVNIVAASSIELTQFFILQLLFFLFTL